MFSLILVPVQCPTFQRTGEKNPREKFPVECNPKIALPTFEMTLKCIKCKISVESFTLLRQMQLKRK